MKYSCCTCKLNEFASLSTSEISLLVFTGVFFLVVIWLECFVFSNTLPADNGLLGWIQFITSWCRDRLQGFTFIYVCVWITKRWQCKSLIWPIVWPLIFFALGPILSKCNILFLFIHKLMFSSIFFVKLNFICASKKLNHKKSCCICLF